MMGGAIPGLVVLGYMRKLTEQAVGSKPVSSSPLWLLDLLLPPGSCLVCVLILTSLSEE